MKSICTKTERCHPIYNWWSQSISHHVVERHVQCTCIPRQATFTPWIAMSEHILQVFLVFIVQYHSLCIKHWWLTCPSSCKNFPHKARDDPINSIPDFAHAHTIQHNTNPYNPQNLGYYNYPPPPLLPNPSSPCQGLRCTTMCPSHTA